jgi:hypothetical protein
MAASPLATTPADRVEGPREAGTIILDGASLSGWCTSPLRTVRSIGATAPLRPARLRVALTPPAYRRLDNTATFHAAKPYAVRMLPACKADTIRLAPASGICGAHSASSHLATQYPEHAARGRPGRGHITHVEFFLIKNCGLFVWAVCASAPKRLGNDSMFRSFIKTICRSEA